MSEVKKILLAEDEVYIAMAVKAILKKNLPDYVIDHARNGAEAWSMAMASKYEVIISDWNMPRKNGDELLADLRDNENTATTPFIMLTAKGDNDSVNEALNAGANDYVIKPFKTPEFIAKVKALLDVDKAKSSDFGVEKTPVLLVVERFNQGFVELPALPDVVVKLNELLEQGGVLVDDLARVVELDAAISSQLIKVANSALVRGTSDCISVDRAITRLGIEKTKNYVMALSSKGMLVSGSKVLNDVLDELWWHSLATAYCARLLSKEIGGAETEKLFLLGLLHDFGKLLVLGVIDDLSKSCSIFDEVIVKEVMFMLHPSFGSRLLKEWGYGEEFQDVVQHHHAPFNSKNVSKELLIVYLANLIVHNVDPGNEPISLDDISSSQAAKKLGVTNEMIAAVLEETCESVAAVKQIF